MESNSTDAAAALAAAEASRDRMADVRLPRGYEPAIGTTIAIQIATAAVGLMSDRPWGGFLALAGAVLFLSVAGLQLWRFRNLNGVWIGGFASRVVLGTAPLVSVSYTLALFGALLAAHHEQWWAVALLALTGTGGYVVGGRQWMARYRRDPASGARGESFMWLLGMTALIAAGSVLLVLNA